ncbi:hypothetical protein B5X24_HaOG213583 [Helicoverpa armigera]|uniref:Uncharacterized protein n=1 Tax=Helicoverpa armigera TaxID=29058 RepID=A0A2W1B957_HELAM|nr:hypothetical protein B5X24_HaOG213583 [Helicoverpa armigera]
MATRLGDIWMPEVARPVPLATSPWRPSEVELLGSVRTDRLGEHRRVFFFSHRPESGPIGSDWLKEHAIGAKRLLDREKVRDRSRSAPLIISHRAPSSILNDESSAHAKISLATNTKYTRFSYKNLLCSPSRSI